VGSLAYLIKRSPLGSSSPVLGISPQAGSIVSITSAGGILSWNGKHTIESVLLVAVIGPDILEVKMAGSVVVVVDIETLVALVSSGVWVTEPATNEVVSGLPLTTPNFEVSRAVAW
jgi:hypothetical protein